MRARRYHHNPHRPGMHAFGARERIGIAFVGVLIACDGLLTLLAHKLHYPNPWGEAVFAPFALVIGAVALVVAITMR